jgi:hypothetical protein
MKRIDIPNIESNGSAMHGSHGKITLQGYTDMVHIVIRDNFGTATHIIIRESDAARIRDWLGAWINAPRKEAQS